MVRAGYLDRRITIEQPTYGTDELGGEVVSWSTFVECWARRRDVGGRERFNAAQEMGEITSVFRIRWREGIKPEMRINHDGLLWDIDSITETQGRHVALDIAATAKTDNA